jgi:hypothetical protein
MQIYQIQLHSRRVGRIWYLERPTWRFARKIAVDTPHIFRGIQIMILHSIDNRYSFGRDYR